MTTDKKTTPLRIINFQAENLKRLSVVNIKPDGALVQITGKNGQGKSSVLDAIWWALEGAGNITTQPIRRGQERAMVRLDLGEKDAVEVSVIRTFKRNPKDETTFTTDITVESPDGGRHSSPQKMINAWLGSLSFDPLEFARQKPAEQFDVLKALVPGYDFDAMARLDKADYDKRTDLNRRHREKTAQVAAIQIPAEIPTAKIDEAALVQEIASVGDFNAQIDMRADRRRQTAEQIEQLKADADESRAEIVQLQAQIDKLNSEIEQYDTARGELEQKMAAAPPLDEKKDPAEVTQRLEDAKRHNALVDRMAQRTALQDEAAELAKQAQSLTQAIEDRATAKQKAIAEAQLPVDGLTLGDGIVLLNGVPFDQASDAERLRTSIAIAMAQNPRLRVIRARDGSLLDEDAIKLVEEMAAGREFQVWLERVDGSGKIGFVLEDGHVKSAPQPSLLDHTGVDQPKE